MCRHLAYLGAPTHLRTLLGDPPYGLIRQSWAPRRQRYGTVNADGFGVGWYADGDPVPARYRRAGPIWADPSFLDLARVTRSSAVLAAVRSATAGTAPDESAAAPFRTGRWLFSHNGAIAGWPGSVSELAATLPPGLLLDLEARTDSALLWALVRHRLDGGAGGGGAGGGGGGEGGALAGAVAAVASRTDARLNLLLTDGTMIAATTYGDTLSYRVRDTDVLVASEPGDDEPGWVDVPDRSVLVAVAGHVTVQPMEGIPT
ncbi:MAG TPA: ergothioneine biosynthesis protein EgtC [Micromonosporaceae bacterium]|nr:ergothioneine biosynthesis protein EgtC [Micromonosporaceae bacterium]